MPIEYSDPKDWSPWEQFREQVVHPAGTIKREDVERARENIDRHGWAKTYAQELEEKAQRIAARVDDAYLQTLIGLTTPGAYAPCPACRAKGLPWHPNGQWSWDPDEPNLLTCSFCKTVFPNDDHPEEIAIHCTWGRGQTFTFVGGDTFECFGYLKARPSLSGVTRARKISHITWELQELSLAYALTSDVAFARAARAILLRFAEVFPEYLVRAGYGYGEYAGMDPKVAAEHIDNLPEDELVYPPNEPDRKLWTGYWSASRMGSNGMDGRWVVRVSDAYSLTCLADDENGPVYSDDDRIRVERDVILEGSYLAACDILINNKAVGNRAGAGVAGLVAGHPGLTHFGLDGFARAVDDWFLPDGGSSESPAYAMMTMNGIRPFAFAFRDHTDPEGYEGPQRLEHWNACRDTLYGDCWQDLVWTLQGDLHFPPSADSYTSTTISTSFADLLALAYGTDDHVATLQEILQRSEQADHTAVFYRDPAVAEKTPAPVHLPDVLFPYLKMGHLRTGDRGRDSLLLLNAADHGVHHHFDGLGLYYWKDGHELLSDLGYLWDHQDKNETMRTAAHNLVMVDGQNQSGRNERTGAFDLFMVTPTISAMEASSNAYGEGVYRRTCVQIDHGLAGSYVLDIFRAGYGARADFIFHGPHHDYKVENLDLAEAADPSERVSLNEDGPDLTKLKSGRSGENWQFTWSWEDGYQFCALVPGTDKEEVFVGDGWGQRDHRNCDVGATLPYVIRRVEGDGRPEAFVSAFIGGEGDQTLLRSLRVLPAPEGAPRGMVAVAIETEHGTDVVLSMLEPTTVTVSSDLGELTADGRLAVIRSEGGTPASAVQVGGTALSIGDVSHESDGVLSGTVVANGSQAGSSWFDLDIEAGRMDGLTGQVLFAIAKDGPHGYEMREIRPHESGTRVFTKIDNVGFEARRAERFEIPVVSSWESRQDSKGGGSGR